MYNTHWALSDLKEPHSSLPLFYASNRDFTSFSVTSHWVFCAFLTTLPPYSSTCPVLSPCACWSDHSSQKKSEQTPLSVPASALSQTVGVLPPPRIAESFLLWPQHTLHNLLLLTLSCEGTVSAVIVRGQPEWGQVLFKIKRSDQFDYSL